MPIELYQAMYEGGGGEEKYTTPGPYDEVWSIAKSMEDKGIQVLAILTHDAAKERERAKGKTGYDLILGKEAPPEPEGDELDPFSSAEITAENDARLTEAMEQTRELELSKRISHDGVAVNLPSGVHEGQVRYESLEIALRFFQLRGAVGETATPQDVVDAAETFAQYLRGSGSQGR